MCCAQVLPACRLVSSPKLLKELLLNLLLEVDTQSHKEILLNSGSYRSEMIPILH
jgi:hypothetical protein